MSKTTAEVLKPHVGDRVMRYGKPCTVIEVELWHDSSFDRSIKTSYYYVIRTRSDDNMVGWTRADACALIQSVQQVEVAGYARKD